MKIRLKNFLFFHLLGALLAINSITIAQTFESSQTKQFATVTMRVYYQGNVIIYDKMGLAKSPLLGLPDGKLYILTDEKGEITKVKKGEFTEMTQVLNYMASFGWNYVSSTISPYEGSSGNTSTSVIINLNQYMQVLVFEQPYTKSEN